MSKPWTSTNSACFSDEDRGGHRNRFEVGSLPGAGVGESVVNLVSQSIHHLEQGLELLHKLNRQALSSTAEDDHGAGIGGHFRHIIDYYRCFFRGLESGRVDYDARQRDPRLEKDRRQAIRVIEELIVELAVLTAADSRRTLEVRGDAGGEDTEPQWNHSSIGRELHFLMSHTVHHYALIAVLLRARGQEPGESFGVAPSTLEHQASLTPCAQ